MKEHNRHEQCSVSWSLLLSFLSGFLYSCAGAIVKHMTNIHPAQLLFFRYCLINSMFIPEIVRHNLNILGPPEYRSIICLQSVAIAVGMLLNFIAFRHLPVGDAAVIVCSYPAFVTIAGKIFLNESFGLPQIVSAVLTIIGMILVTGVYERIVENSAVHTEYNIYGLVAAVVSILFSTLFFMLARKMKGVQPSIILFASGITAIIECAIVVVLIDEFRPVYCGLQQVLIIVFGILGYCASKILIIATQNYDAGPVSTMRATSDILFSFVFQIMFFHDIPNKIRILGAVLIILSIILVGFKEKIDARLPQICMDLCKQ